MATSESTANEWCNTLNFTAKMRMVNQLDNVAHLFINLEIFRQFRHFKSKFKLHYKFIKSWHFSKKEGSEYSQGIDCSLRKLYYWGQGSTNTN